MNELKPCPFCGKKMTVMYSKIRGEYIFSHKELRNCPFLSFEIGSEAAHTLNEAASIWNRRTAPMIEWREEDGGR